MRLRACQLPPLKWRFDRNGEAQVIDRCRHAADESERAIMGLEIRQWHVRTADEGAMVSVRWKPRAN